MSGTPLYEDADVDALLGLLFMDAFVAIVHILSLWFWESVTGLTEAYNFVNISPFRYTNTILRKNGKLSELIGELQVRRLAAAVRQLGSSLQRAILKGNDSQIQGLTSLIMPTATLGALGYGYMWWKGLKFSDLMYVTKRSMNAAVSKLHKRLESNTKKHLTQRVQNLDDKLLEQKYIEKSILDNVCHFLHIMSF
ncbi:hypothetical protein PRUPE_4G273100 [Prunus persica]|uniref:DUF1664 domain-containing protein n=1 Tax=Prunus persica TaxID=3760 RepID=A0A251PV08_PRUPE|nr:hypothetical protein PRUPE_4G273100 [Prunus persica]